MARNAGRARARKDSARILYIQYMKISFLFSFISCLKIYCMYVDVYVCQELVGHEDIEQNPKRLSSCGFQKHGVSSYTPSQTHCPCVCVCVCGRFCSRRPYFITRQPYFVTFSLGGISLRSLNSPWGFRFQNGRFGICSRHLYFVTRS